MLPLDRDGGIRLSSSSDNQQEPGGSLPGLLCVALWTLTLTLVAQSKKKHPGFQAVQSKIARKAGVSKDRAGAILAASSRGASAKAKRKNPRLRKV